MAREVISMLKDRLFVSRVNDSPTLRPLQPTNGRTPNQLQVVQLLIAVNPLQAPVSLTQGPSPGPSQHR